MTDRELLEMAAKAAGVVHPEVLAKHLSSGWNPLTDDGDALRLAVKLRMRLTIDNYGASARMGDNDRWWGCEAHLHGGVESATRRAIVRAAAALGEKL